MGGEEPKKNAASSGAMRVPSERKHERVELEVEVNLASDSNFYAGFSENISECGLFVATHSVRPVGTKIDVVFELPNSNAPIRASAVVRWTREFSEAIDSAPGMGVRFEGLSDADAKSIKQFLSARDPLFFDDDDE